MYRFSDSDSVDSDKGIRYKTDSIRHKDRSNNKDSSKKESKRDSYRSRVERNRSRSRSPRHHGSKRKKVKRRKKEYSSDEDDREQSCSRHKDKRKDEKGHKERVSKKEHESLIKKNKSSKESRNDDLPRKQEDSSTNKGTKKAGIFNKDHVLGPVLPPHLLEKGSVCDSQSFESVIERPSSPNPTQGLVKSSQCLQNTTSVESNSLQDFKEKLFDTPHTNETKSAPQSPILTSIASRSIEENKIIGPDLPPDLNKKFVGEMPNKSENVFGPALPPDLTSLKTDDQSTSKVIGPSPPHFIQNFSEDNSYNPQEVNTDLKLPDESADRIIGPALPPHLKTKLARLNPIKDESSEEDEVYGPIPAGENFSKAHIELEERALKIKMDRLEPEGDKQPTREEWMLTLPEARAAKFGLGPRSFRAKAGPDLSDRSPWTDTPEDKAKKKAGKVEPKIDLRKEAEMKEIQKRDKEQEAIAKKSKKHDKSLLEIHQKKIKKEKNENGPEERRPFSREIDLQVNRFDEAQKKAVLKKAQLLDTRFSTGESKYL